MVVREIIKANDINTYRKLKNMGKNKIKLGDKPAKLMRHDSYRREGRRIRQTR